MEGEEAVQLPWAVQLWPWTCIPPTGNKCSMLTRPNSWKAAGSQQGFWSSPVVLPLSPDTPEAALCQSHLYFSWEELLKMQFSSPGCISRVVLAFQWHFLVPCALRDLPSRPKPPPWLCPGEWWEQTKEAGSAPGSPGRVGNLLKEENRSDGQCERKQLDVVRDLASLSPVSHRKGFQKRQGAMRAP